MNVFHKILKPAVNNNTTCFKRHFKTCSCEIPKAWINIHYKYTVDPLKLSECTLLYKFYLFSMLIRYSTKQ